MDPTGLSKPLEKLIEVIASGIGVVSRPYLIRRTADARAYEIRVISNAIEESRRLIGEVAYTERGVEISGPGEEPALPSLDERIERRLSYQQAKRQRNLEAISQVAADELRTADEVSDEPVDEDWISRFFLNAEDVSNEMMQRIWGKILAGEVKKPGSYSVRTLEVTRNLTQSEAEAFANVGRLAVEAGGKAFVLDPDNQNWLLEKYGISLVNLLLLQELGLMYPTGLKFVMHKAEEDRQEIFILGDHCLVVERPADTPQQSLPAVVLTGVGKELIRLVDRQFDLIYAQKLASLVKHEGVAVKYSKIVEFFPDGVRHSGLMDLPPEDTQ